MTTPPSTPQQAATEYFLGAEALLRRGKLVEATQWCRRALSIDPHHADSLHLLGVMSYQRGGNSQAIDLISHAIRLRGDAAHYHVNLGNALQSLNRLEEAISSYRRALALAPGLADTHYNLALMLGRQGNLSEAAASYRQALDLDPSLMDALLGLAAIHLHRGALADAVACYERAQALDPRRAQTCSNLGYALHLQGRFEAALDCYRRALSIDPGLADAHNNMGFTLQQCGKGEDAIACYQRALNLDPQFAEAANNLGNALKECGQFERARSSYERAIAIRPDYAQAHFNRADVKVFHAGDRDLETLEQFLAAHGQRSIEDETFLHFALAKALEDSGDAERAFGHLLAGNGLKRRQLPYDAQALDAFLKRIRAVFDRPLLERCADAGEPSPRPVFIVGMPRSGSTLVEQILASHPQIRTMGERDHLQRVIERELDGLSPEGYPETMRHALHMQPGATSPILRRLGAAYLSQLPPPAPDAARVIDKLPGNFMHIGLIRAILPNARIIHVGRDPLDTCLSCFSKLFDRGQEFTYDLAELGQYYRRYRELMDYWRHVLAPGSMLEVAYEDVVADLAQQAKRMIEYCGLPWDDRCLEFHTGRRSVTTASAVQVRQPLFASSVGRWRRFEAQLAPLIAALNP